jgi:tRNA(fMet)-specific endonuclease VapC
VISLYEVLRGRKYLDAKQQTATFTGFVRSNDVITLDDAIARTAADLYATLRREGRLLPDADLLIAATALAHGHTLVTSNLKHFERVPGLQLENWAG